jgi:hypothetical protein
VPLGGGERPRNLRISGIPGRSPGSGLPGRRLLAAPLRTGRTGLPVGPVRQVLFILPFPFARTWSLSSAAQV